MTVRRNTGGDGRKKKRNDVTVQEFYQYLFHYFLNILLGKGRLTNHLAEVTKLISSLHRGTRFEEISASCQWTPAHVETMHNDFNLRVPMLIRLGLVITIDETVLAYFGIDALRDEILRHIPGKPHPFGLLGYRAVVRLSHSRARVVVAIFPIIPHQMWTPTDAALKIIYLLRDKHDGGAHYVMDSAFATEQLLDEVRLLGASVSISLKSTRTAGYGALYDLATRGLRSGEVRSYSIHHYLLQSRRKASTKSEEGEKTHVVLSSGWRVPSPHDEPIKRLFSYETVVRLYLDEPAEALSLAFKVLSLSIQTRSAPGLHSLGRPRSTTWR